jgi:hypothetical protein
VTSSDQQRRTREGQVRDPNSLQGERDGGGAEERKKREKKKKEKKRGGGG